MLCGSLRADRRSKVATLPTVDPGAGNAVRRAAPGSGGCDYLSDAEPQLSPRPVVGTPGGARRPAGLVTSQALMGSVDGWPLATITRKTLGGKPKPVTAFGRDWSKVSSS